jgi:hypothetical protein
VRHLNWFPAATIPAGLKRLQLGLWLLMDATRPCRESMGMNRIPVGVWRNG